MSKKFIAAVIATVVVLFGSIYFISGSKARSKRERINPAFREYITAYTSGYVSTESRIQVVLAKPAKDTTGTGNLFEFTPSIEGKMYWVDDHTVASCRASV